MSTDRLQPLLDQLDADTLELARLADTGDWEAFAQYQQERDRRIDALDAAVVAALQAGTHTEAEVRTRLLALRKQNDVLAERADQIKEALERQRLDLERKAQAVGTYEDMKGR